HVRLVQEGAADARLRQGEVSVFEQPQQLLDMLSVFSAQQLDARLDALQEALEILSRSDDLAQRLPKTLQVLAEVAAERLVALRLEIEALVIVVVLQHQEGGHPAADAELLTVGR